MEISNKTQDSEDASPPKRQRAKHACEPCRLRKRRCDGTMPCDMCIQFQYSCYYGKHPRKRSKIVQQNAQQLADDGNDSTWTEQTEHLEPFDEARPDDEYAVRAKNMEANSAHAFTKLLAERLNPSAGSQLFNIGWNLGCAPYEPPSFPSITRFLTQDQMYTFAQTFFRTTHVLYSFLDKDRTLQEIAHRWARPSRCEAPDHFFAHLAIIGALFGRDSSFDLVKPLVEPARRALDATNSKCTSMSKHCQRS